MKDYKIFVMGGFGLLFLGVLLIIATYFSTSFLLFFIGSFFVVIGFILVVVIQSLNLFLKDKELEIEKLKEMGLTIVTCQNCLKENVLEDLYCIHCGESLGSDKDDI